MGTRRRAPVVDRTLLRRSVGLSKPSPKPVEQPRKPSHWRRTIAWLRRGRLWDDVFTRALAGLIVVVLAAIAAGATGLIKFTPQAWASVVFFAGIPVAVVSSHFFPWEQGRTRLARRSGNSRWVLLGKYVARFLIGVTYYILLIVLFAYIAKAIGGVDFLK